MITLQNTSIKASFSAKGAELQSLFNKITQKEYMWSGDAAYWGKFSPVLFPIVGALKGNSYLLNNNEFKMSRHGFARDQEFRVSQISETEVIFTLSETSDTLLVYPYRFELVIRYELIDDLLRCTYEVKNPAAHELLFSIGAHPAFSIPTGNGIDYSDYYLEFNKDSTLVYHKIDQDLIDDETVAITLQEGKLPLKYELFYEDALVFKSLKSDLISIRNIKDGHGLNFQFKDFPFFGIWAAKDADFICLEPWCGVADGVSHNQDFMKKEGIISLEGSKDWTRSWEVRTF